MDQYRDLQNHSLRERPAQDNEVRDNHTRPDLHTFVRSGRGELERQLAEWVRVPGVLGVPEHAQDLTRSASWLEAAFRQAGFPVVELLRIGALAKAHLATDDGGERRG